MSKKFLVPQVGGFTDILSLHLEKGKNKLDNYMGKVWYTVRKNEMLTGQAMGKNMVFKVPHEIPQLHPPPPPTPVILHLSLQENQRHHGCRCRGHHREVGGLFWMEECISVPGIHFLK
jgi:hypothetical protein